MRIVVSKEHEGQMTVVNLEATLVFLGTKSSSITTILASSSVNLWPEVLANTWMVPSANMWPLHSPSWIRITWREKFSPCFCGINTYLKLIWIQIQKPSCKNPPSCCYILVFRTILLSVISLLNEPNTFSPANVDASVMFRKWRDSKGKDNEYEKIVKWVKCFISNFSSTHFKAVL